MRSCGRAAAVALSAATILTAVLTGCGAGTQEHPRGPDRRHQADDLRERPDARRRQPQRPRGAQRRRAGPGRDPRPHRPLPDRAADARRLDPAEERLGPGTDDDQRAGWRSTTRPRSGTSGNFDSGASAVSIPLLNKLGIPEISPASTVVGLTSAAAGAAPGEPVKYYPTRIRTFARVVPERRRAGAGPGRDPAASRVPPRLRGRGRGGRRSGHGRHLPARRALGRAARRRRPGLPARGLGLQAVRGRGRSERRRLRADQRGHEPRHDLGHARRSPPRFRRLGLFGTAGVSDSRVHRPGRRRPAAEPRLAPADHRAHALSACGPPGARAFYAAYTRRFGLPQPAAIYGYEAMSLMLSAISRATDARLRSGPAHQGPGRDLRHARPSQRARHLQHRRRRRHLDPALWRVQGCRRRSRILEGDRRMIAIRHTTTDD